MMDKAAVAEQSNAANRVIVKACDMCRKKKIRCVPTVEGCAQCTKYVTKCHFTPISLKRKPRKPAGLAYTMQLEERLTNMEGLLRTELKSKEAKGSDSLHDDYMPFGVFKQDNLEYLQTNSRTRSSQMALLGLPGQQMAADNSPLKTLLLSPSVRHSNQTSRRGALEHGPFFSPPRQFPFSNKRPEPSRISLPPFQELPTESVALELVQDTFSSFNRFFPLFDEQDFLQQFRDCYAGSSPTEPGWWACINVVLSLAHRFRAMRTFETTSENVKASGYINNALAVVSQLNMLRHSLPAVQALVGMALILQGTPNPHAASALVAAAVRLAQSMGLHRSTQDPSLTKEHAEQRRRVFWITYFLDKDISLRMGLPSAQNDDDMDAELPSETALELSYSNGTHRINFFKSRIGLAVIQGQIYKSLYSVQATRQSGLQKGVLAQELNSILSYWRSSVSIDFEDDPAAALPSSLTVEILHMLILRFTYINCLAMIDRCLPPSEQLLIDAAAGTPGAIVPQESICVIESRKAISLIQRTPHGNYACIWILLHPFFAAVTALLQNVLRHPASPQARFDLRIVEPFFRLLGILAGEEEISSQSDEAQKIYQLCNDLNGRATEAVELMNIRTTVG